MSRRKQSNPKPLLKSECQDNTEEMTIDGESKDLDNSELIHQSSDSTGMEQCDAYATYPNESSMSPKSSSETESEVISNRRTPDKSTEEVVITEIVPKLRLNALLASDPALKPDAKDLKLLHEESKKAHNDNLEDVSNELSHKNKSAGKPKTPSAPETLPSRMKVFMCLPCGIGFSSPSTLEAHQSYYCSHRKDADDDTSMSNIATSEKSSSGEPSVKSIKTGKQYACPQCSYSADKKVSLNRHMRMHQSSPAPSSNASNGEESSSQQVDRYCSDCDIRFSNVKTYRAHKLHYCSSRRNDGQTTPKIEAQPTTPKGSGSASPQATVRSKTPIESSNPPQPFLALPTNPVIIIPYSIIRAATVIPGPLSALSPAGFSNSENTCFSLVNGSLKAVATALNNSSNQIQLAVNSIRVESNRELPSLPSLLTEKNSRTSNTESTKIVIRKDGIVRESSPLDLSLRKSPIQRIRPRSTSSIIQDDRMDIDVIMEGKENLSIDSGTLTPEQIVCAPSLPNSPSLSPSPKRRLVSPRGSGTSSVSPIPHIFDHGTMRSMLSTDMCVKVSDSSVISSLISKPNLELALKLTSTKHQADSTKVSLNSALMNLPSVPIGAASANNSTSSNAVGPQIYVKQGVSKCKECNIVFCKYENYLAHKQHYCSARNQDEVESKISHTPPSLHSQPDTSGMPYHQLICAACGIKYTSLDNLRAHQKFYCPKGGSQTGSDQSAQAAISPPIKEKCVKCKTHHENTQTCQQIAVPSTSYKCPVCEFVSLTAADSRKHLETHGSVKAFRCSICKYKGNTLRGMRTHIRMHFDKKTSDFNEENYMSCILEDDGIEVTNVTIDHSSLQTGKQSSPNSMQHQLTQGQQQSQYNCDICNYSSSYKGNVLRHMKLVHSQPINSPSVSPEIDDNGLLSQNGEVTQTRLDGSLSIKTETAETSEKTNNTPSTTNNLSKSIKMEPLDDQNETSEYIIPGAPIIPSAELNASVSPLSGDENSLKNTSANQYCQTCDIKFNFMKTYLAHKQFYCKNNKIHERSSPSPSVAGSPTLIKNKETLEAVL